MSWRPRKSVVVPIDFSESAAPAVQEALNMAESAACVHVVHVLPDLDAVSPGVIFGNITDDSRKEAASKYASTFLESHKITGVQTTVLIGDAGTEVVEFAKQKRADVIVVPSHGYHGVKHLLLGSVAERIIRHADCPVFVLRRLDAD